MFQILNASNDMAQIDKSFLVKSCQLYTVLKLCSAIPRNVIIACFLLHEWDKKDHKINFDSMSNNLIKIKYFLINFADQMKGNFR